MLCLESAILKTVNLAETSLLRKGWVIRKQCEDHRDAGQGMFLGGGEPLNLRAKKQGNIKPKPF